jgi:hypothetical protein
MGFTCVVIQIYLVEFPKFVINHLIPNAFAQILHVFLMCTELRFSAHKLLVYYVPKTVSIATEVNKRARRMSAEAINVHGRYSECPQF